jgi:chitodextrinase
MRALDPNVMSGAILRVDRNGRGLPGHRFCRSVTDLRRSCTKVWSKGFRNPFRFSLLPDGRVAVGDVGFEAWEELNLAEAGRSYGWPCREGNHPTPGYANRSACRAVDPGSQTGPLFEYAHGPNGGAIMAGPLLGGSWPAGMSGRLVLGDYAVGTLSLLDLAKPALGTTPLLSNLDAVVDVTAAPGGGVALVEAGFTASGLEPGRVWVLGPAAGGQRPWPRPKVTVDGLSARFDSRVADADSASLTYLWDFGDGTTSTEATPTHAYSVPGSYQVRVTVSDGSESGSDWLPVNVGLALPVVTISSPAPTAKAVGGGTVRLAGSATVDGVPIRPSALNWTVLLHHGSHEHYLTGFNGTVGSFVTPRDHDADSWYEVRLTATTLEGRTATSVLRVDPKLRTLRLATSPAGIGIGWAGRTVTGPRPTAVGFRSALSVPKTATVGGRSYRFSKWSDGSRSSSRQFSMPDRDTSLTATYVRR